MEQRKSSMNRYQLQNAIEKVRGYFLPKPHENTPLSKEVAFHRAKAECIVHLEQQLADIRALKFEQFSSPKKFA